MHVVLIPSWYKVPDRPVVGSFFEEQARMLMRAGVKVGIVYPIMLRFSARWKQSEDISQPADFVDDGLPTYYTFQRGPLPLARGVNTRLLARAAGSKLRRYVSKFGRPDLLHSHALIHGGIVGEQLARAFDIPFVHTEHLTSLIHGAGSDDDYQTTWAKRVYRAASRCLVVSRSFGDDLADAFGLERDLFEAIPNVVSERFVAASSSRPTDPPFVFFTNCFFSPRKNLALLLEAFELVSRAHPDVRLRIGGCAPPGYEAGAGGGIESELQEHARRLGIADRVAFLGRLSRDEVVREIANSHAFALTSRYESFGVVLIEALAVGRPVVTTASAGPREIVEPADGLLVEEHEPEPFAQAMTDLIDRYAEFDPSSLATRCRERFSEEVIGKRTVAVYEAALGSGGPRNRSVAAG